VIPAIQAAPRCEVAIASRDPARAGGAAESLGIPRPYASYEELLEDPEVEAVYIPLPNHLHAPWTLAAAQAGKHVLVEKPLALSAAQAEEMVEACRRAGVKLMEGFMYRLHPQWVTVRDMVASGRLGELRAVRGFFSYRQLDPANIRFPPDRSTRLVLGSGGRPPIDRDTEVITIPPADQYTVQAERFATAVLEDTPVPISVYNGIANLRVIETVLASAGG
jgi:predicted dehydrogenase